MSLGIRLKQLRKQNNFTQEQMCEKLMMEQSLYSKYENDKISPNVEIIRRVASVFNVSTEWLMQPDCSQVTFEEGSINNGNGFIQTKNYYAVPKEFMDAFFKQQQMLEVLMKQILEKIE